MNTNDATRATAEGLPEINIIDTIDILNRAWSQVELINMAAEACNVTGEAGNAIAYGCISVQELLDQVKEYLEPRTSRIASNVGTGLSEMLVDHAEVTAAINRHKDDDGEADKLSTQQCEIALAIIGYRPLTKLDERRKAEFLHEWTKGAVLTEDEQRALITSMMPEGAAS